jgi:hypothetical protein
MRAIASDEAMVDENKERTDDGANKGDDSPRTLPEAGDSLSGHQAHALLTMSNRMLALCCVSRFAILSHRRLARLSIIQIVSCVGSATQRTLAER